MNSQRLSKKLFGERSDLRELEESAPSSPDDHLDIETDVDEKDLSLSAWKTKAAMKFNKKDVLSEDAIREMFAPRPLTRESKVQPDRKIDIVRAVKKNGFAGDTETEAKDFLVDEHEGLIGSQG